MKINFALALVIICHHAMAQSISGIIRDKETGEPVQYAYVLLNGSVSGTVTNSEGLFKLVSDKITDLDSLVVTHVGYATTLVASKSLRQDQENVIEIAPLVVSLDEVIVSGKDPYEYFSDVTKATKVSTKYPFSTGVYFRELVKDNNDFSKYSDALLSVNYSENKDDIVIGVEQSRVIKLPKETDDIVDVASPIDVKKIFEYQYLTILNRFQGDNRINYDYSMHNIAGTSNQYKIEIAPSKNADKNKLLYFGEIIVENNFIKDIVVRMDTTSKLEKSALGLTAKINNMEVLLAFRESDNVSYLSFGKVYISMNFDHKRFIQLNEYQSEFIVMNFEKNHLKPIDKKKRFNSKTLYKHGDNHNSNFWEGINIPIYSKRDRELIEKLKADQLLK